MAATSAPTLSPSSVSPRPTFSLPRYELERECIYYSAESGEKYCRSEVISNRPPPSSKKSRARPWVVWTCSCSEREPGRVIHTTLVGLLTLQPRCDKRRSYWGKVAWALPKGQKNSWLEGSRNLHSAFDLLSASFPSGLQAARCDTLLLYCPLCRRRCQVILQSASSFRSVAVALFPFFFPVFVQN